MPIYHNYYNYQYLPVLNKTKHLYQKSFTVTFAYQIEKKPKKRQPEETPDTSAMLRIPLLALLRRLIPEKQIEVKSH